MKNDDTCPRCGNGVTAGAKLFTCPTCGSEGYDECCFPAGNGTECLGCENADDVDP